MPFSTEQAERICTQLQSGLTLKQVADKEGISKSLILWNVAQDKDFADQYAHALDIRTELDFEGLMDLAFEDPERTDKGIDPAWVQLKRLQVDTLKWALSKRNPKKYGEKTQHEHELTIKTVVLAPEQRPRKQLASVAEPDWEEAEIIEPDGREDGREES